MKKLLRLKNRYNKKKEPKDCWSCEKSSLNGDKVTDHCHLTGKNKEAAQYAHC